MKHRLALFLLIALAPAGARAQSPDAEARLLADLQLLTSDLCEGRGITTKGIELAADYIERQFVAAGLQPGGPDGSYSQRFTLSSEGTLGKNNSLTLKGPLGQTITLQAGKDFAVLLQGGSGEAEAPLVFAGYGITSSDPAYDDYAGLDVAGKIVVILADTPRRGHAAADVFATKADPGAPASSLRVKAENARKRKAAGLLVVNTRSRAALGDVIPKSLLTTRDFAPWELPMAHVARDLVDGMLVSATGNHLTKIERDIDGDLKPRSFALEGWTCRLETDVTYKRLPVRNVIGVLEGSGPLAKETIVIGAHYDHVGQFGTTRRFPAGVKGASGPGGIGGVGLPLALAGDPAIHHGADDNASGTSALMEIARRFGADKKRQGRRIVFIAFTAEESGLLGSEYYCQHPIAPLADTVAMINMDQVGRLQDDKILVGGVGSAKQFEALVDKLNEKHRLQVTKEKSGFAPSDNASFYVRKVPAIWFFTGFHEQYHRPTDRWETLNVPGLARVAALVGDAAAELATMLERPEYVKTETFDRTKTLWATAPSIGLIPRYADKTPGVVVDEVFKGTAAAKAGLQKGDRILALGSDKLPDATAFHTLTRKLPLGAKVDLAVNREGKDITLVLQVAALPSGFTDAMLGIVTNLAEVKNGVPVMSVIAGGPAAKAGIQKGDRLTALNGEPIVDRDGYMNLVRALKPGDTVPATITRGEMTLQLKLALGKAGKTKSEEKTPPKKDAVQLFNGKNLDGWTTWLKGDGVKDPKKVFSVREGVLHVSGEGFGYVGTKEEYQDYHLTVEYRWGKRTDGGKFVRNSGVLLHATGPDGNAGGTWMASIECQLAQGCVGDLIAIRGKNDKGEVIPVAFKSETALGPDKRPRWQKGGEVRSFPKGQLWWSKHDPTFKELLDTRGKEDVESPLGEWTKVECICRGGKIEVIVNGTKVNDCFDAYPQKGRILLQSEGFELEFRKVELVRLEG